MNIETFYKSVINGQDNVLSHLTGPMSQDIKETVDMVLYHSSKVDVDKNTLSNRKKISGVSRSFHKKADTFSSNVSEALNALQEEDTILIESAHQPNLFPYSGMMIKPVLVHIAAEFLREKGFNVVEIFGSLDRNDLKDGWTRRTALPDVDSKEGILTIRKTIPSKKNLFISVSKPDVKELNQWKDNLVLWVKRNRKRINAISRQLFDRDVIDPKREQFFFSQIKEAYTLWEDISDTADNYGTFNSFFLSKLFNEQWGYPALFVPYSSSIHIFEKEIMTIMRDSDRYVGSYNKHRKEVNGVIKIDFRSVDINHIPFWYVCQCGRKIRLMKHNDLIMGKCGNCGENFESDITNINKYCGDLEPTAISRHLISFEGLKPVMYVSGWGAMPFTLVARGIADDLEMYFPPVIPFRKKERYYGIGQLRAFLELRNRKILFSNLSNRIRSLEINAKRLREQGDIREFKDINQEIRDLKAIQNTLNCYPSILDYWVNFGLKETRDNWEEFIKKHNFWDEVIRWPISEKLSILMDHKN